MKTTLNKIRAHSPCETGWKKLLLTLGKTKSDNDPLSLRTILDSNGLDDALWCLLAVDGQDRIIRLYAVWCANQVRHLMTDSRSVNALVVAEKYANGLANEEELAAARDAAWGAARAAARDGDAARDAQEKELRRVIDCCEYGGDPYKISIVCTDMAIQRQLENEA